MSLRLTLKNEKGWFAAGAEVEKALTLLSDGACKLFVYLCLEAPRDRGTLEVSQLELAKSLRKGTQTIRRHLREMENNGVCLLSGFAPVPYCRGTIEITEPFWPYRRTPGELGRSRPKLPPQKKKRDDTCLHLLESLVLIDVVHLGEDRNRPASLRSGGWTTSPESLDNIAGIRSTPRGCPPRRGCCFPRS